MASTLESGIEVGQRIIVGPGRIIVAHKQNVQSYVTKNPSNLKIFVSHGKIPKFNKRRAFNKDVGPGKRFKIDKHRAYVYSRL